jgi:hypothetical protein
VVQVNHHFLPPLSEPWWQRWSCSLKCWFTWTQLKYLQFFFNETQYYLRYPTVNSQVHPDMLLFLSFLHYTCKIKFYKLVYKETFILQNIFQHSSYNLNNISNELYNIRVLRNGTQTRPSEMLVSLCQLTWHNINKDLIFINTTVRTSDLTQFLLGSF